MLRRFLRKEVSEKGESNREAAPADPGGTLRWLFCEVQDRWQDWAPMSKTPYLGRQNCTNPVSTFWLQHKASQMDPNTISSPQWSIPGRMSQDYNLLYLPVWTRGLGLGEYVEGIPCLCPRRMNPIITYGTRPTKNISCGSADQFCLDLFMTMVMYLTLTSHQSQLPHLVPKQVLNHSGAKPSQAQRGNSFGQVCVPAQSTDIKTKTG